MAVIAILCVVCSSIFAGVIIQIGKGMNAEAGRFFDVSIDPSNASLVVGQVQEFTVHSSSLGKSLNYSWSYFTPVNVSVSVDGVQAWWNGSGTFEAGGSFSFSFLSACAGLRLSVHVVDNDPSSALYGGCGDATTSVFDPYSAPSVYLDAFPIGTIIETDGAGWYRYTVDGQQKYSSTNASQVFIFAVGNSTSQNQIFVKTGAYQIDTTIAITPGHCVTFQGETMGWNGGIGVCLNLTTANIPLFNVSGPTVYPPYVFWNVFTSFRDLWLFGNHLAGSVGIVLYGRVSDMLIQRVNFDSFEEASLELRAHGSKIWNIRVDTCLMESQTTVGYGVYFAESTDPITACIDRVSVYNTHFYGSMNAMYIGAEYVWNTAFTDNTVELTAQSAINATYGRSIQVTGNRIFDCSNATTMTYGGIFVNGTSTGLYPSEWTIENNIIHNHFYTDMLYGIWLTGVCKNFIVTGNTGPIASGAVVIKTDGLVGTNMQIYGNELPIANEDVGGFSYLVFTDGSNYFMRNGSTGRIDFSSSNASAVINNALGNLTAGRTWQETVLLKGNFTLTNTILVGNHTHLIVDGTVTLAGGANCDMIANMSPDTVDNDVTIEGGIWLGNWATQSAGCGLNWTQSASAPVFYPVKFIHMYFSEIYDDAVHIDIKGGASPSFFILDVDGTCSTDQGSGLWANDVTDSVITHCHFAGNALPAIQFVGGGGMTTFSGIRTDGYVYFQGSSQVVFGDFTIDCYNRNVNGLELYISNQVQVSNGFIRADSDSGFNTKAGIQLTADFAANCSMNSFSNIFTGRPIGGTDSQQWAYGVLESASGGGQVDWNTYIGINAFDALTAGIVTVGANSKVQASWNGTFYMQTEIGQSNAGATLSCINGTEIAHGLAGAPTSLTLSLRGPTAYNATIILCAPTVLSINATHFIIELTAWETVTWTLVPITAAEAQTVYWIVVYKP